MPLRMTAREADGVIVIRAVGHLSAADVVRMRADALALMTETGICDFYVDLSGVEAIASGSTLDAYQLGVDFGQIGLPQRALTAVRMPEHEEARRQAEFLHTVELNRGRGVLRYVESLSEALEWFRSRPAPT